MFVLIHLFTALSFIAFGGACLFSVRMKEEFQRYGLPGCRILIGWLQLLGAVGLFIGYRFSHIGFLAAAGLCVLMLLGCLVRRRIRDSWLQTMPALSYMALSFYVANAYFMKVFLSAAE